MRPRHLPIEEIRFAAKTGFLTKTLWEDFFGAGTKSWQRRKWKALTEKGLFLPHPSAIARNSLVPNPHHRLVREIVGSEIVAAPFVAQIDHDETLSRILLHLSKEKTLQQFATEAEQKHQFRDDRRWVDRQEALKFPDAILDIGSHGDTKKIALEIELTAKSQKRYRKIFETYRDRKQIQAVIFVVSSSVIFKALSRAIKDAQYPDWKRPIGFGRVDEWSADPWTAPIHFRETTISLRELPQSELLHRRMEVS